MVKPKYRSPAVQALREVSYYAAITLKSLVLAETPEEEQSALSDLWALEADKPALIDAHAELATHLDSEIESVEARLKYYQTLYGTELKRLKAMRDRLDETVLHLHEQGMLDKEATGENRRILIKLNPPSVVDELTDIRDVDPKYVTVVTTQKLNKKQAIADWKKGKPVKGVTVRQKQKVVYEIAPKSLVAAQKKLAK